MGAVLALLLASPAGAQDDADRAARKARFEACVPESHNAALICLDQVLTAAERERILNLGFRDLHDRFNNEDVLVAMQEGWLLENWQAPVRRDLRRAGAPDPMHEGRYDAADILLESYWLWRKGCRLDLRARLANARKAARSLRASRMDEDTLAVVNIVADPPLPPFTPRCPSPRAVQ